MTSSLIGVIPPRLPHTKEALKERVQIMRELRMDGYMTTDLSEMFGISKGRVATILKTVPGPDRVVFIDKPRLRPRVGRPREYAGTHGRRFKPEYYSWYSMKTRCGNPTTLTTRTGAQRNHL